MSDDDTVEILGVGDRLRDEIESGGFDRFVVFTYGITPEYLEWFDEGDRVAICGPGETVETVRETKQSPQISVFNRQTHAKIYLLYNDTRIVAYLGSFNFTRTGLYGGVEWGARYEGEFVESPPDPETLVDGQPPTEISPSPIIEQILTVVSASMTGTDTDIADSWVANTGLGEGIVHTLRSTTLQSALSDMLRGAEAPVTIAYYSPFVTYGGVAKFASYLPESLDESDIELEVYTKRLERIQADEPMLSPEDITKLDERFGAFRLRVRAPGDQGNQLADGREIRNGMAHLKTITLTEEPETSTGGQGVILTSANLSDRAWDRTSEGFEVGVALTDTRDSRWLHRLFTHDLPQCYVDPSERELAASGGTGTPQTFGTEVWLDTQLRDRTVLQRETVIVEWNDSLPAIETLTGRLAIRNTSTGERNQHQLSFDPTESGFTATFPPIGEQSNQIIDFVRLKARTQHAPPELEYSAREVQDLRAEEGLEGDDDPLPTAWTEFDEIIWNGSVRKPLTESSFGDVDTLRSVQLRSTHESDESYYAILEPESQPHIDRLLRDTTVTKASVEPLGMLVRVSIETHPSVSLDPADVAFYTSRRRRIRPLGFANREASMDFYFSPEVAGETITVQVESLVGRYIRRNRMEMEIEDMDLDGSIDLQSHVPTNSWEVIAQDIHPVLEEPRYPGSPQFNSNGQSGPDYISTEMAPLIQPPQELLDTVSENRLAVWWRASGAFQSGTIQSISTPISKQTPRSRVVYRGILRLESDTGSVNIRLPGGDYLVTEQPFVDRFEISLAAVPTVQKLDRIQSDTLLGWAVIQQTDLLALRASDVTQYIQPRLYADGEALPRRIFDTTAGGGLICIPLLGAHLGTTQTLTLRLWLSGGPAKTEQYAEAARDIDYAITRDGDGLRVKLANKTRHITHSGAGKEVTLEQFAEVLDLGEFKGQTKALSQEEIFSVKSYNPLRVVPREMFLLHFTDQ